MKAILLAISLVFTQQSFAGTLKCVSIQKSNEKNVSIEISMDAFSSAAYSGAATVEIRGLYDSFMNVKTDKAIYMKLENNSGNPIVMVPLQYKGDGQVLIIFKDKKGKKASVQHVNVDDDYTDLAEISCK